MRPPSTSKPRRPDDSYTATASCCHHPLRPGPRPGPRVAANTDITTVAQCRVGRVGKVPAALPAGLCSVVYFRPEKWARRGSCVWGRIPTPASILLLRLEIPPPARFPRTGTHAPPGFTHPPGPLHGTGGTKPLRLLYTYILGPPSCQRPAHRQPPPQPPCRLPSPISSLLV